MGLLLRRAHNRTTAALIAAMRPYGLELRHFAILIALADRGPTLQRDLVDATGFDKAAVGRAIDDLQADDLVTRLGVEGDRRVWMVQITDRGLEIFDEVHREAQGIAEDLVAHLKPGEADQIMDLLTRYTYPDL
jgi:MarR family transcriptional regulator, lower aerobic nicotinate degradation pathway regulator